MGYLGLNLKPLSLTRACKGEEERPSALLPEPFTGFERLTLVSARAFLSQNHITFKVEGG